MNQTRVAVVGCGAFGRNHLRVLRQLDGVELVAAVDLDAGRARVAAAESSCQPLFDWRDLAGRIDAAVVAVPTVSHEEVSSGLLRMGLDVLVEKPVAPDAAAARRLISVAEASGRILQVGHLESFNPAVTALRARLRLPLFFEIHRLSEFTPRSLDIDVVLDLMIHDIEVVLSLVGAMPEEVRAAGISILSGKVDIANARLAFPSGCIANLTASRVSTERVRKLRLFQPHQYISIDYGRQDAVAIAVSPEKKIGVEQLAVNKDEPLRLELEAFLECVRTRAAPRVGGPEAMRALEVALEVLARIEEHAAVVSRSVSALQ